MWGIKVEMAQYYIDNLSEEVKKGQAEKIRQGGYPCRAPLGYKTVGEKGHKMHVLDNQKASVLRAALERYATGNHSMSAIVVFCKESGLRTSAGKPVVKSHLEKILQDPWYFGAVRWNGKIENVRGQHPALVSKELFDRIQEVRTGKKAPQFRRRSFQFRKMLTCGATITAEIKKGRYIYYHCNHYKPCSQVGATPEQDIENQLLGVFRFFETITPEEAEEIKTRIKQNHAQEVEYKENTIRILNERYSALQRRLDMLYDDRLGNRISLAFWESKQKEIAAEQAGLQDQLAKLKSDEAKYFEIWLNIIDLARRAREIYEKRSPDERRMLLRHLFSNLVLKDGKVAYTYKKSTAAIARRVQERLDTQNAFEPSKNGGKKGKSAGKQARITTMLPG